MFILAIILMNTTSSQKDFEARLWVSLFVLWRQTNPEIVLQKTPLVVIEKID